MIPIEHVAAGARQRGARNWQARAGDRRASLTTGAEAARWLVAAGHRQVLTDWLVARQIINRWIADRTKEPPPLMTRPTHITPHLAPGGIVLRIYRLDDDTLLRETRLSYPEFTAVDEAATADWVATGGEGDVVITPYDGDTGELMTLPLPVIEHFASFGVRFIGWGR